ncbi:amino acid transporter [Aureobasidium pullulans]|nr:amino acid transporter [Aureobasidium pullulans]
MDHTIAVMPEATTKPGLASGTKEVRSFDGIDDDADLDYHGHLRNTQNDDGFTRNDAREMKRMGKKQELRRNFRTMSTIAFTIILQGTWEVLLTATTSGMVNGGLAGLVWSYIWTFFGFTFVVFSLAEMASMCPTAGGQYHWISEFAPPSQQKILSFLGGWMSTLSWQAGTASGPYLVGTLIQSLIYEKDPNYGYANWQGTLLVIGITLVVWATNIWGSRAMPVFQNIMMIVHVLGFLVIIVMIWVLAPRNTASDVFGTFTNSGGWSSMGLSLMVGQVSAVYACICSDAAAHVSEEVKDAGRNVPRAMIWSYFLNGALGLVFLITYMFSVVDLSGAIDDANNGSGYPYMYVFTQAFSMPAFNVLSAIVVILIYAGTLSYNVSTSRQTWSFARDRGLPFSDWIAKVDPKREVPNNAVAVTCMFTILLSLINIGSDAAFNAIVSLNLTSLMITYVVSIGCVLYRRLTNPDSLPKCRWSLGRWGIPINTFAVVYSGFVFFWMFWPQTTSHAAADFNWSVLMFMVILVIAVIDWVFRARKTYTGPVVLVEGYKGE